MLIGIKDTRILNYCFRQYCQDHDLDIDYDPDAQRCAITAYSHYVQNCLTELYDVEIDEEPERCDEKLEGCEGYCINCRYAYLDEKLDLYCKEHDYMAVDSHDGCSDWEMKDDSKNP